MDKAIAFNNDDQASVKGSVVRITNGWFDPNKIYSSLKDRGVTNSSNFWSETESLLDSISHELSIAREDFDRRFKESCHRLDLRLIAFHCTRSSRPETFIKNGILPLNEEVLWAFLSESAIALSAFPLSYEDKKNFIMRFTKSDTWLSRVTVTGVGPYFFLSYQEASNKDNHFLRNGSEICWAFVDSLIQYCRERNITLPTTNRNEWRKIISQKMSPLIIRCSIPYSFLLDDPYYSFCMFKSYFNYIDPEDDFFESGAIDLKGNKLDPQYIVDIERL